MSNLVEIRSLNIRFTGERTVYAVNDLSLSLGEGEVLGLLGESGSGKSVTLRALMRLLPNKRTQISGSAEVLGRDVLALDDEQQGTLRQIVRSPIHPYARGLLASTVHGAKRGQRLETIPGTRPSLDQAPSIVRSRPAAVLRKRAASSICRPMCSWRRTGSHAAFWRSAWLLPRRKAELHLSPAGRGRLRSSRVRGRKSQILPAQTRIGPEFDLGRPDDLLGLMRVECPCTHRPAFRQNLHGEQLGVHLGPERPRRTDRPGGIEIRFQRFVGPIGHVPGVGLGHGCITPVAGKSFVRYCKRFRRAFWAGSASAPPNVPQIGVVTSRNYG
jgi:energy-coupling factor transporter ATP-binding protein EcfA2